ncbi:MAG: hypothetical protein JW950_04315 [Deltaproteobacteria bacterium]|nr:hypothetical protein [Deltaproteobacteria bacterium]
MWRTCINEGVTPGEARKRGLIPRPDSIESFPGIVRFGSDTKRAGDADDGLVNSYKPCHTRESGGSRTY